MVRYTGGIITKTEVEPSGNFTDSTASGVWSIHEALRFVKADNFPNPDNLGPTGAFGGGGGSVLSRIDFISIPTTGNATDWGDLSVARKELAAVGNSINGVFVGGRIASSPYQTTTMDYITWASQGNAADWGD